MTKTITNQAFVGLKNIKIAINPFFWVIIIGSIITGQFIEIITLFAVVIIHELGHVFAAISYGFKVIEIQLLPFGGVAKVEQATDSIWEEIIVAIAGPLQNLIMIIIAFTFLKINLWSRDWATFFIQANIWIGLFNLLPIAPLDGYKILRGVFYYLFPYKRAIMISIFLSIVLTIIFLLWSLGLTFGKLNINGALLSVFFVINNFLDIKQAPYAFWRFLLRRSSIKPKRNTAAIQIIVKENTPVISALHLLKKDKYHLFYLINDQGEVTNILTEEKMLQIIIHKKEIHRSISDII